MAKRRKKKQPNQLSSADKNHLSRILKKVRAIKAAKQNATAPTLDGAQQQALKNAYIAAYQNFLRASKGRLQTPTDLDTFQVISQQLSAATAALQMAGVPFPDVSSFR